MLIREIFDLNQIFLFLSRIEIQAFLFLLNHMLFMAFWADYWGS